MKLIFKIIAIMIAPNLLGQNAVLRNIGIGNSTTTGATNSIIFQTSNNIGIGTAFPSEKLHVSGNILSTGVVTASSISGSSSIVSNGSLWVVGNSLLFGSNTFIGNTIIGSSAPSSSNNKFEVIGTTQLTGNVNVGTSTSSSNLSIFGDIRNNNSNIFLRGGNDINHGIGWFGTGKPFANLTPDGPVLYGWNSGILGTTVGGQKSILRWSSDGKVVIGNVNTPNNYKLYVESGIMTEKVKVAMKSGDWSDFVFEEKYYLRSLNEVDSFIKSRKHLPDIPSSTEIENSGVDLGKMDALLLQKIEELTLYVIQLKKENEFIKEKILKLNSFNN